MSIASFIDPAAPLGVVGTSFAVAWAQNGTAAALSGFSALRRELWLKVQEQADDGYRAVLRLSLIHISEPTRPY